MLNCLLGADFTPSPPGKNKASLESQAECKKERKKERKKRKENKNKKKRKEKSLHKTLERAEGNSEIIHMGASREARGL